MNQQAHVAEVAALDAFRSRLLVYLEKAGRVLDDVHQQVVATRLWLQSDRQLHWKQEIRKRSNHLDQAQQELLSARLSGHQSAIQDRRMAVARAQQALADAERSLQAVKRWLRQYDSQVEARLKTVTRLRHWLTHDMKKGTAFLDTAATVLAEYAELAVKPPAPARSPVEAPTPGGPTPSETTPNNPNKGGNP